MRKGYSDGPYEQIHWRMQQPEGEATAPDLYCLHPAPFSGLAFTTVMPHLAEGRRVIALDYPGHGGSDPITGTLTIKAYAETIAAVIDDLSGRGPVDLLGFHTGCLVALATGFGTKARGLVLLDAPFFDAEIRRKFLDPVAQPPGFTPAMVSLAPAWKRGITHRIDSQPMDRAFEIFVEQLRHGEAMNAAFAAARDFDVQAAIASIAHPVTVIATRSDLHEPSRAAANVIPGATLVERLDVKRAVLDEAAKTIAPEILSAVSNRCPLS